MSYVLAEFKDGMAVVRTAEIVHLTEDGDAPPAVGDECIIAWGRTKSKHAAKVLRYGGKYFLLIVIDMP
jgi:hypothetical protein